MHKASVVIWEVDDEVHGAVLNEARGNGDVMAVVSHRPANRMSDHTLGVQISCSPGGGIELRKRRQRMALRWR